MGETGRTSQPVADGTDDSFELWSLAFVPVWAIAIRGEGTGYAWYIGRESVPELRRPTLSAQLPGGCIQ